MDNFNNSERCKETTEQGLVSRYHLPAPRPYDQPCSCCFHLDVASAIQRDGDEISVDPGAPIVCLRRNLRRIKNSAASACQVCAILLKVLGFFDLDPQLDDESCNIILRFPIGLGSFEMSFCPFGSEVFVQIYTCMCMYHPLFTAVYGADMDASLRKDLESYSALAGNMRRPFIRREPVFHEVVLARMHQEPQILSAERR
jgi:hypothetical protein